MRVIHDLERIGDGMVNISKATRRLHPHGLEPKLRGLIERMRDQAVLQLSVGLQAFSERNPDLAAALPDMDDTMDELQKELFRSIFVTTFDEETVQRAIQVALVGRYFERIADHAVNFGERVEFMVTGQVPPESHA